MRGGAHPAPGSLAKRLPLPPMEAATSDLSAAGSRPTIYPTVQDLESEIEVIEALAASPRLMADNANLR